MCLNSIISLRGFQTHRGDNDKTEPLEMDQSHGGARAKNGVSAQGYLLVGKEHLFVPTGNRCLRFEMRGIRTISTIMTWSLLSSCILLRL